MAARTLGSSAVLSVAPAALMREAATISGSKRLMIATTSDQHDHVLARLQRGGKGDDLFAALRVDGVGDRNEMLFLAGTFADLRVVEIGNVLLHDGIDRRAQRVAAPAHHLDGIRDRKLEQLLTVTGNVFHQGVPPTSRLYC